MERFHSQPQDGVLIKDTLFTFFTFTLYHTPDKFISTKGKMNLQPYVIEKFAFNTWLSTSYSILYFISPRPFSSGKAGIY